ncbi:MAG: PIG-L deacetylase family protein [Rudaea sp.]
MSEVLRLNATERVLVLAPHPDDEAIACGGLLLAARAAGAARRVVVVTDGDTNPWPQRWIEKRWRIDSAARARWGARRREEAQAALDVLGVDAGERCFFGLPDTGLTDLLMHDAEGLPARLREQIEEFQPTLIALPALEDRHPDHSAVHIVLRVALLRAGATPRCLTYSVHGKAAQTSAAAFALDATWREQKRTAIAQHATQMRLSGKRFLAYADALERYHPMPAPPMVRADHPLRAHFRSLSELELCLGAEYLRGRVRRLQLLVESEEQHLRWCLPFAPAGTGVTVTDESGRRVQDCQWRQRGGVLTASLQIAQSRLPRMGYAKVTRKRSDLLIFDRYGWQIIENSPAN